MAVVTGRGHCGTTSDEGHAVTLPSDFQCWPVVRELLLDLQGKLINEDVTAEETVWYVEVIHNTIQVENDAPQPTAGDDDSIHSWARRLKYQIKRDKKKSPHSSCVWFGLLEHLKLLPLDESESFLYNLLPRVIELALGIESTDRPMETSGSTVKLSRQFACSTVSCLFLCLFPQSDLNIEAAGLNVVKNFFSILQSMSSPCQVARLKSILCYFECIVGRNMELPGDITISKKHNCKLTYREIMRCEIAMCPVYVHEEGTTGDGYTSLPLQLDLVSRDGDALVLRDDVRLCSCPELLAVFVFVQPGLSSLDAVAIYGFEQFSHCSGSGKTLTFDGPASCVGKVETAVSICRGDGNQQLGPHCCYKEDNILADLNAVLVAISQYNQLTRPLMSSSACQQESAQDVAADMVTTAFTEAISQANDVSTERPAVRTLSQSPSGQLVRGSPSPSRLGHLTVDVESLSQASARDGSLPASSYQSRQRSTSPLLVVRTSEGLLTNVYIDSDPLGNLSEVRVGGDDESLLSGVSYLSPASSSFQGNVDTAGSISQSVCDTSGYSSAVHTNLSETSREQRIRDQTIPATSPRVPAVLASVPSLERAGSGCSNLSLVVNLDSPTLSCASIDDELTVDASSESFTSFSSSTNQPYRLAKRSALSPKSKLAELQHHDHHQQTPPSSSVSSPCAVTATTSTASSSQPPSLALLSAPHPQAHPSSPDNPSHPPLHRQNSRDLYVELQEFLSSSSSASRDSSTPGNSWPPSGIHPPLHSSSSCASSLSSRSGSLSSHRGSNGFTSATGEFLEFWNQHRRRSSNLSQASDVTSSSSGASRRSSSSHKYSTDFSTDLEDISESLLRFSPGIIEEEGGLAVATDFATQFVTAAVKSGMVTSLDNIDMTHTAESTMSKPGDLSHCESKVQSDGTQENLSSTATEFDRAEKESDIIKKSPSTKVDPHRPLLGKVSPRAGTLVRQQEVSVHPEDEEICVGGLQVGREVEQKQNVQVCAHNESGPDHEAERRRGKQESDVSKKKCSIFTKQSTSKSSLPLASQKPKIMAGKDSTKADLSFSTSSISISSKQSSYHSSGSKTGALVCEGKKLEMKQAARKATPSKISSTDKTKHAKEQATSSGSKFTVRTTQTGQKTLFATLESKTIYLKAGSLETTKPAKDQSTFKPKSRSIRASSLPVAAVSRTSKSGELPPERLVSVESQKAKSSGIPKVRSVSEPSKPSQSADIVRKVSTGRRVPGESSKLKKVERTCPDVSLPLKKPSRRLEMPVKLDRGDGAEGDVMSPTCSADSPSASSGASGPHRSSGIPRYKSTPQSSAKTKLKSPTQQAVRERKTRVGQQEVSGAGRVGHKPEPLHRPHKSRYVVSDVAAPLPDKKSKKLPVGSSHSQHRHHHHHHHYTSKRVQHQHGGVKTKSSGEIAIQDKPPQLFQSVMKYVNSLVERSLGQGVLEGADLVSSSVTSSEISEEVYNWFSNKIISRVFSTILDDFEGREQIHQQAAANSYFALQEIGASSGSPEDDLSKVGQLPSPSPDASATDYLSPLSSVTASHCSSLKPSVVSLGGAGIAGSPPSPGGQPRRQVKFQVSSRRGSDANAAETSDPTPPNSQHQPAGGSSPCIHHYLSTPSLIYSPTQHWVAPTSNVRRRRSFDLASLSPPVYPQTQRQPHYHHHQLQQTSAVSPPLRLTPLTTSSGKLKSDETVEMYQVAANIVDQVFQNISDSVREGQAGHSGKGEGGHHYDGRSFVSNIFSSSPAAAASQPSHSGHRHHPHTRRSVSPATLFSHQPMSRQVLTSAFLRVEGSGWAPTLRTYQRRSSEPGQTSVELSLQALNSIKFSTQAADEQARQRRVSRTDDDIGRRSASVGAWRRGSLDASFSQCSATSSFDSARRRSSCGFKDPVLSQFAEELMKADTSVPELVIVGSHPSSSSTGSRRSSWSAFRDTTLANLESELLNTSFTSVNSLPLSTSNSPRSSQRRMRRRRRTTTATTVTSASTCDSSIYYHPDLDRSHSRESAYSQVSSQHYKSDSSDAEYWFPPPRLVGEEFRVEYDKQHSQEELQDFASLFAGQVVHDAVSILRQDTAFTLDTYVHNLTGDILREVYTTVGAGAPALPANTDAVRKTQLSSYYGEGARPKVRTKLLDVPPAKSYHKRRSSTWSHPTAHHVTLHHQHLEQQSVIDLHQPRPSRKHARSASGSKYSSCSSRDTSTSSSVLSSSSCGEEEDIGPQGLLLYNQATTVVRSARKKKSRRHAPSKALVAQHQTSKREKKREPLNSAQGECGEVTVSLSTNVAVEFANELSCSVMSEALLQCSRSSWLRFESCDRPLVTRCEDYGVSGFDLQLQFILVWMAATLARCPLHQFYTYGDARLTKVQQVINAVSGCTVGEMVSHLRSYCCLLTSASLNSTQEYPQSFTLPSTSPPPPPAPARLLHQPVPSTESHTSTAPTQPSPPSSTVQAARAQHHHNIPTHISLFDFLLTILSCKPTHDCPDF